MKRTLILATLLAAGAASTAALADDYAPPGYTTYQHYQTYNTPVATPAYYSPPAVTYAPAPAVVYQPAPVVVVRPYGYGYYPRAYYGPRYYYGGWGWHRGFYHHW